MLSREQTRARLNGYVPSLHTIFHRDGEIDYDGIRRFIDFVIDAGSKSILITPGDSLYALLSDEEIGALNKVVVDHVAGRALVIAAAKNWWTGKTVEFAKYARQIGADVLLVYPPQWATSTTPDTLVDQYAAVARHMPVMVFTPTLMDRGMETALHTIRRLRDEVPDVVAVKEDCFGQFGRRLSLEVYGQWSIIGGGEKQNHMNAFPYGIDGYLSTFIKFMPRVTHAYWQAIDANDVAGAVRIIAEYDIPYFDFAATFPDEYDSALHGVLELFGVAQRWRRPPFHSLSDAQMQRLRAFFEDRRWL